MKEISELSFPDDRRYAQDHEWVKMKDHVAIIGISDYAQDQLGDIVYVELPQVGDHLDPGAEFGTVESVKAVSELYMPIGGEVTAVNPALEDEPALVNEDPYEKGWMIKITPTEPSQLDALMDRGAYLDMIKGE